MKNNITTAEIFLTIILSAISSILVSLIFFVFVARPITVYGESMIPTLKHGDVGFLNIAFVKKEEIHRFDYLVINTRSNKDLIKRVIALPGETFEYHNGDLYINGTHIQEPFIDAPNQCLNIPRKTLKENEYYCLGDNREISIDSRNYGPFTYDQILGKAYFKK